MNSDHFLMFSGDKLVSPTEGSTGPSTAAQFVHSQFRAMVLNAQFPCPGARTAFTKGTYRFGLFDEIGTRDTAIALGSSLKRFIEERVTWNSNFTPFVSCYKAPIPMSHEQFAHLLWAMLQELHVIDFSEWDPKYSPDPDSPDFAFSYAGTSFFVNGIHSGSPRFARRFGWPTIVFNTHEQFDNLRREGIFEKFRDGVRKKDKELQGYVNPAAEDVGVVSEAIQYTGIIDNPSWKCPFKHKTKG